MQFYYKPTIFWCILWNFSFCTKKENSASLTLHMIPDYYQRNLKNVRSSIDAFEDRCFSFTMLEFNHSLLELAEKQIESLFQIKENASFTVIYIAYSKKNDFLRYDIVDNIINIIKYQNKKFDANSTSDNNLKFEHLRYKEDEIDIYFTDFIQKKDEKFMLNVENMKNNEFFLSEKSKFFYHNLLIIENFEDKNLYLDYDFDVKDINTNYNALIGFSILFTLESFDTDLSKVDTISEDSSRSVQYKNMSFDEKLISIYKKVDCIMKNYELEYLKKSKFFVYYFVKEDDNIVLYTEAMQDQYFGMNLRVQNLRFATDYEVTDIDTDTLSDRIQTNLRNTGNINVSGDSSGSSAVINPDSWQRSNLTNFHYGFSLSKRYYNGISVQVLKGNMHLKFDENFNEFSINNNKKKVSFTFKIFRENDIAENVFKNSEESLSLTEEIRTSSFEDSTTSTEISHLKTKDDTKEKNLKKEFDYVRLEKKNDYIRIEYYNRFFNQKFVILWGTFFKEMAGNPEDSCFKRFDKFIYGDLNKNTSYLMLDSFCLLAKETFSSRSITYINSNKNLGIENEYTYYKNKNYLDNFNTNVSQLLKIERSLYIRNKYVHDIFYNSELIFIEGPVRSFNKEKCFFDIYDMFSELNMQNTFITKLFTHEIIDEEFYKYHFWNDNHEKITFNHNGNHNHKHSFWENYLKNIIGIKEYKKEKENFSINKSFLFKFVFRNIFNEEEVVYSAIRIFDNINVFKTEVLDKCRIYGFTQDIMKNILEKYTFRENDEIKKTALEIFNILCDYIKLDYENFLACYLLNGSFMNICFCMIEKIVRFLAIKKNNANLKNLYFLTRVIKFCKKAVLKSNEVYLLCILKTLRDNEFNIKSFLSNFIQQNISENVLEPEIELKVVCQELLKELIARFDLKISIFSEKYTKNSVYNEVYDFFSSI